MTTIIYKNNQLLADRFAIVNGGGLDHFKELDKIKIAFTGDFAYGISGFTLQPEDVRTFEATLFAELQKLKADRSGLFSVSNEIKELLSGGRHLIVMTLDAAYVFRKGDSNAAAVYADDEFLVIGSGKTQAEIALLYGKSPEEALRFALNQDILSSGGRIDIITRSQLQPIASTGPSKKSARKPS